MTRLRSPDTATGADDAGAGLPHVGTFVETQLMGFDKVQEDGEMIRVPVRDLDGPLPFVDTVAATLPEACPVQGVAAGTPARLIGPAPVPRKTAAAPVAASNSQANAVVPFTFTSLNIPRDNTPISTIYVRYRPQRIEIEGAQEHPTPLVESIAMASVAPPIPSNTGRDDLRLPARLIEEGHRSEAQLETIIMAHVASGSGSLTSEGCTVTSSTLPEWTCHELKPLLDPVLEISRFSRQNRILLGTRGLASVL